MIKVRQKGDFSKTIRYINNVKKQTLERDLRKYGEQGVRELERNTPVDTGLTASSWRYEIKKGTDTIRLSFHNDNIQNGIPIAIILQYGHATRNGGWVEGVDYINPSLKPVFDKLLNDVVKGVRSVE